MEAIIDASVTVVPLHMAGSYDIQESAASRACVQYEVANCDEIQNL